MTEPPKTGGRVLLERASSDDRGAVYEVTLIAPEGQWHGQAELELAGRVVRLGGLSAAPDWLVGTADAFLKTLLSAE